MPLAIVLDSEPLGLVTQRQGVAKAELCRTWLESHLVNGDEIVVPEIIDYEVRRELLRAGKTESLDRLDKLAASGRVTFLTLRSADLRLAAELWARARVQGKPTAPDPALDVDVILAAQALNHGGGDGSASAGLVVATGNVGHLSRFLKADLWQNI